MGEAIRRKADIEKAQRLGPPIDPMSKDPSSIADFARRLHSMFECAKEEGDTTPAVLFAYEKIEETTRALDHAPLACARGCGHCCRIWASATAPELFVLAREVRARGEEAIRRVREAHEATKHVSYAGRQKKQHPCAMLVDDVCSAYEIRPKICRLVVSTDVAACARFFVDFTGDAPPATLEWARSRTPFLLAFCAALRRAGRSYSAYEFSAGLVRILDTPDAERRWLSGEDVFAGVSMVEGDMFENPHAAKFFGFAFPDA